VKEMLKQHLPLVTAIFLLMMPLYVCFVVSYLSAAATKDKQRDQERLTDMIIVRFSFSQSLFFYPVATGKKDGENKHSGGK